MSATWKQVLLLVVAASAVSAALGQTATPTPTAFGWCSITGVNADPVFLRGAQTNWICNRRVNTLTGASLVFRKTNFNTVNWAAGQTSVAISAPTYCLQARASGLVSLNCSNALDPMTEYEVTASGSATVAKTKFYTPGDCRLLADSVYVDCLSKTVNWQCALDTPGAVNVMIEVTDAITGARTGFFSATTSPLSIPTLKVNDTVSVSGLSSTNIKLTVSDDCTMPTPTAGPTGTPLFADCAPTDITLTPSASSVIVAFGCQPSTGVFTGISVVIRSPSANAGTTVFSDVRDSPAVITGLNPGTFYTLNMGMNIASPTSSIPFATEGDCVLTSGAVTQAASQTAATVSFACSSGTSLVVTVSGPVASTVVLSSSPYTLTGLSVGTYSVYLDGAGTSDRNITYRNALPTPTATAAPAQATAVRTVTRTPAPVRSAAPAAGAGSGSGTGGTLDPSASAIGDPHVTTLDGVTVTYLNNGDNLMLRSGDFAYYARHCSMAGEGSSTCAVAIKCSSDAPLVEVYALTTGVKAVVGGKERDMSKPVEIEEKDVVLTREPAQASILCPSSGFRLVTLIHDSSKFSYFDTLVWAPEVFRGKTEGLMGIWDGDETNDVMFRTGEMWERAQDGLMAVSAVDFPELSDIQDSWMVKGSDSPFTMPAPSSTGASGTSHRRNLLASFSTDSIERVVANTFCKRLGLSKVLHNMCVFDYMVTQDESFVRNILDAASYFSAP